MDNLKKALCAAVIAASLLSTAKAGDVEGGVLHLAKVEVENALLRRDFPAGGYSEVEGPTVLIVDCEGDEALNLCTAWGSYIPAKREIRLSTATPIACRRSVLLFELTRDAFHAMKLKGGDRTKLGAVAYAISGLKQKDGRYDCEGKPLPLRRALASN